jgi:hypothetical protein
VATGGSSVHLAEVLQAGYTAGSVSCTATSLTDQTGSSGAVDVTVQPGETWTCTFNNATNAGTINVLKLVDGTQTADWTINASAPDSPAGITPSSVQTVASGNATFSLDHVVAAGSTTTLSEVLQAGYTAGAVSCAGPRTAQNGVSGSVNVTVMPGETWTCTFNNTTNTATIRILKLVDGTQTAGWTINASSPSSPMGVSPSGVATVASGTSDFALDHVATDGSSVHLAEVLQANYAAGAVNCAAPEKTAQTGLAGAVDVTVRPGETWTCTFNNSVIRGSLQVTKTVFGTPGPGKGYPFTVSVSCTSNSTPVTVPGSPFTLTSAADSPHTFTGIPVGSICTVTETAQGGADLVTYTYPDNGGTNAVITTDPTKNVTVNNIYVAAEIAVQLNVSKVLTANRTVPDGTQFIMHVTCTGGASVDKDLTFTAPNLGAQSIVVNMDSLATLSCTITETGKAGTTLVGYSVDGGANQGTAQVTVTIDLAHPSRSVAVEDDPGGGIQVGGIQVKGISTLPFTGTDIYMLVLLATGLLSFGLLLVIAGRRRGAVQR